MKIDLINIIITIILLLLIVSSLMVVVSKNPIHSVFFLILVFLLSIIILFFLDLSFIGMMFLIIYVGAIAVLFLFVIMLLNIRVFEDSRFHFKYIPASGLLSFIFLFEICIVLLKNHQIFVFKNLPIYTDISILFFSIDNIKVVGGIFFNYYYFLFILCGFILLVAMFGSIVLTFNLKKRLKNQDKMKQLNRNFKKTILLKFTNSKKFKN